MTREHMASFQALAGTGSWNRIEMRAAARKPWKAVREGAAMGMLFELKE